MTKMDDIPNRIKPGRVPVKPTRPIPVPGTETDVEKGIRIKTPTIGWPTGATRVPTRPPEPADEIKKK